MENPEKKKGFEYLTKPEYTIPRSLVEAILASGQPVAEELMRIVDKQQEESDKDSE